ncbi:MULTISPECIES: hypothetical protein [Terriglobus]|jgi:hypothetical protein|uniref:Uncharacterized protein n=2 Tax=Terriglobus TaxID=392733 RepID=A0A1H4W4Z2_9BACT|nr:hypothetical protein [Terriglobus roseus]SEC87798.1 hypothetical protein SAMN05443244_4023 [Terriglobus roseus]
MNLKTLENDLSKNLQTTAHTFAQDAKAEGKHIADPSQCGSIVQRHFDGIAFGLMGFIGVFLVAAVVAIAVYTVR